MAGKSTHDKANRIVKFLHGQIKSSTGVTIGMVCGSGFGKIVDIMEFSETIHYKEISGFPQSSGNPRTYD